MIEEMTDIARVGTNKPPSKASGPMNKSMTTIQGEHPDLDAADSNWIDFTKPCHYRDHHGAIAAELLGARGFECTGFPFQVWVIIAHDVNGNSVAVLRANQSTLAGALQYMAPNRVLVYNREADLLFTAKESSGL